MTSDPPKRSSNHDMLENLERELSSVKRTLSRQVELEAERAGASKMVARITALFGGVMTAAIIGTFVWAWNTNVLAQVQGARLERVMESQVSSAAWRAQTSTRDADQDRSIALSEQQSREILRRLEQVEESNQEILVELRRGRRR